MSDQDLVVETVRDILSGFEPFVLTPERRWDDGLWSALAESGLTGVGLPEELGGSGGELADAVAIVRTLASGAAAVPVAEQLLVAGPAVIAAGLTLPPVGPRCRWPSSCWWPVRRWWRPVSTCRRRRSR